MRSRFTAFALGNARYLLDTWHLTTRPRELQLDEDVHWYRLDIIDRVRGGLLDANGIVEFEAWFRHDGARGSQRERSRFVREGGKWWYLDAE
jgi:SEC-C motif-containing protein